MKAIKDNFVPIYQGNLTDEYCPHCDNVVEIDAELKVQVCPNCGKHIVTCSMCTAVDEPNENYCAKCCLCHLAETLNSLDEQISLAQKLQDT